uniref:Tr-type G domain-containing protein n=1 Tax=Rhabditophanes sp. KR3021 TaxID=114890 RepID=A0AC35TN33_9BILA
MANYTKYALEDYDDYDEDDDYSDQDTPVIAAKTVNKPVQKAPVKTPANMDVLNSKLGKTKIHDVAQQKVVITEDPGVARKRHDSESHAADLNQLFINRKKEMLKCKIKKETKSRPKSEKDIINIVIAGDVDSGKSTTMGHLLYLSGKVDERTHKKNLAEATNKGKASFAFAWLLDANEEERDRGVTMGVGKASFDTQNKRVIILDAPGHKDFIPNMISGAAQGDAAILVLNSTIGEFEKGISIGGQTTEHSYLLANLGIKHLIVAANKLDTVNWSKERFNDVSEMLMDSLKESNISFTSVTFIPISGLKGINLHSKAPNNHPLRKWYNGDCIFEAIDKIRNPESHKSNKLRVVISSIIGVTDKSITASCKIISGHLEAGMQVYIIPSIHPCKIKCVDSDEFLSGSGTYYAGDQVVATIVGKLDEIQMSAGLSLCSGGEDALVPVSKFVAKIVLSGVKIPIISGVKVEIFSHSLWAPCTIKKLYATMEPNSYIVKAKSPRLLRPHDSALVEIETEFPVNLEPFKLCEAFGRFTLRHNGETIGSGIVELTD